MENNMVQITPEKVRDETEYMLSSYEKKREERVKKNKERLQSLGLLEVSKVYNVKEFVGHKLVRGNWKLKTIWEGYPEEDFTWESLKVKIKEVPELVKEYIERNPEVGHPPVKKVAIERKNPCVRKFYLQSNRKNHIC
jgi:hypothetical protein